MTVDPAINQVLEGTAPLAFSGGPAPDLNQRDSFAQLKFQGEDGWGVQAPKKKPGDIYVIIGAVIGMVVGGILGYYINIFLTLVGIVAGGVVGAVTGWLLLSLLRKQKRSKTRQQDHA